MSTGVLALCLRASRSPPRSYVPRRAEKHSPDGRRDRGAARVEAAARAAKRFSQASL